MCHNQTRSKSRSLLEFLFYLLHTNSYLMQTFIQFQYGYFGSFFLTYMYGKVPFQPTFLTMMSNASELRQIWTKNQQKIEIKSFFHLML